MASILNITNGDCAVGIMQEVGILGDFLPWRDVLHEGPVPADLDLQTLSQIRVAFLAGRNWGKFEAIEQDFKARDKILRGFEQYDKVILWFEHDLYDQLQLLQILDWFSSFGSTKTPLSLICTEQYLGMATPQKMRALSGFEAPITAQQCALAKHAWAAFRSPTPVLWQALLDLDLSCLPFLHGAIIRQLEEYPNYQTGLSRTAQMALDIIAEGEHRLGRIFAAYGETEERLFMGDTIFWGILSDLLEAGEPLLQLPEGQALLPIDAGKKLTLTPFGKQVQARQAKTSAMMESDRWIGGVRLPTKSAWCWDSEASIVRGADSYSEID